MQYIKKNKKNKKQFNSYQEVYQDTFGGSNPVSAPAGELPLVSLLLNQTIPGSSARFARPNDSSLNIGEVFYTVVSGFTTAQLTVITNSAQPGTDIMSITARKNGVGTTLVVNIADGQVAGTYSQAAIVAFVIGDTLSFRLNNSDPAASAQITSITIT